MAMYSIPVVFTIEADSLEEAQKAVEEWADEVDEDNLPAGTGDVDAAPHCIDGEDGRTLHLPTNEDVDTDDLDDGVDDFNDADVDDFRGI